MAESGITPLEPLHVVAGFNIFRLTTSAFPERTTSKRRSEPLQGTCRSLRPVGKTGPGRAPPAPPKVNFGPAEEQDKAADNL